MNVRGRCLRPLLHGARSASGVIFTKFCDDRHGASWGHDAWCIRPPLKRRIGKMPNVTNLRSSIMISKIALCAATALALVTMTQLANARVAGPVGNHYLNSTIGHNLNPTIGHNLNPTIGH